MNNVNRKGVVLVGGCGREGNIGQAAVTKFSEEGYIVVGADIKEFAEAGFNGDTYIQADLTDKVQVQELFGEISHLYGRLDIVVNAAGVNLLGPIGTYPEDYFDKTIDVNLKSNFLMLQQYVSEFDNDGVEKRFIVVGSDTGMVAKTSTFAYGASKAGVHHFVRCTARELNKYHADDWMVSALAIGMVEGTPMDNKTIADLTEQRDISEEEARSMLTANIPTGRGATPREVAEWLYFMATKGEYATGNILRVDSGQLQG